LGITSPRRKTPTKSSTANGSGWAKKRTFVRALEGTYSHLYKKLLEEPRVYYAPLNAGQKHGHLNSAWNAASSL
jgi:hypothetical protein